MVEDGFFYYLQQSPGYRQGFVSFVVPAGQMSNWYLNDLIKTQRLKYVINGNNNCSELYLGKLYVIFPCWSKKFSLAMPLESTSN
jgi:hypothetical protein